MDEKRHIAQHKAHKEAAEAVFNRAKRNKSKRSPEHQYWLAWIERTLSEIAARKRDNAPGKGENPWVKVEDFRPETGTFVLCYNKHSGIEVSKDTNHSFKDVTHWMPLPPKPEK